MTTYFLKIVDIKKETFDSLTIRFKQPGLKKIIYQAGQYLSIVVRINNRKYIRPYSFSSSPTVDHTLDITVKRVNNGIVSNFLFNHLKIGDTLEVIPPLGSFVFNQYNFSSPPQTLVLWAGGSGITPLFSIAKEVLSNNKVNKVVIVYSNKNKDSTIFIDALQNLAQYHKEKMCVIHFFSQGNKNGENEFSGRLLHENIRDIFSSIIGPNTLSAHYISGPTPLKDLVKSSLLDLGIKPDYIFVENFGDNFAKAPVDVKDRVIKLKNDNDLFTVNVTAGKTILEAALDQNIDIPYSCQTGDCLLCLGLTVNGSIMTSRPINEMMPSNGCLLCSSYPMDDNVEILISKK